MALVSGFEKNAASPGESVSSWVGALPRGDQLEVVEEYWNWFTVFPELPLWYFDTCVPSGTVDCENTAARVFFAGSASVEISNWLAMRFVP